MSENSIPPKIFFTTYGNHTISLLPYWRGANSPNYYSCNNEASQWLVISILRILQPPYMTMYSLASIMNEHVKQVQIQGIKQNIT